MTVNNELVWNVHTKNSVDGIQIGNFRNKPLNAWIPFDNIAQTDQEKEITGEQYNSMSQILLSNLLVNYKTDSQEVSEQVSPVF